MRLAVFTRLSKSEKETDRIYILNLKIICKFEETSMTENLVLKFPSSTIFMKGEIEMI